MNNIEAGITYISGYPSCLATNHASPVAHFTPRRRGAHVSRARGQVRAAGQGALGTGDSRLAGVLLPGYPSAHGNTSKTTLDAAVLPACKPCSELDAASPRLPYIRGLMEKRLCPPVKGAAIVREWLTCKGLS
jgi:hypothetical protein